MSMQLFQRQNLTEVAAILDVHPFDIARMLGQEENGLPKELLFTPTEIKEIHDKLGLETWWKHGVKEDTPNRRIELILELARKCQRHGLKEPVRGDNLYRGLQGDDFQFVRAVVNVLIKSKILRSTTSPAGIQIQQGELFEQEISKILEKGNFPAEIETMIH